MRSLMAAKTQKQKSIWKLGGLTPWELTRNVFRETAEENLLGRASGLAFDFLLALFPLIVFLLSLFGQFASRSYELRRSLLSYFADVLPPLAFQLLSKITDDLSTNPSSGKLTLGILVTLWFASGGVAAMISSLNVVYRVRESRSWFKVRFIALGLTIVISVLILWALLIVLVGGSLVDWVGKELHFTSGMVALWKALRWPTAMAFVVISYALVYCFGPKLLKPHWYWI